MPVSTAIPDNGTVQVRRLGHPRPPALGLGASAEASGQPGPSGRSNKLGVPCWNSSVATEGRQLGRVMDGTLSDEALLAGMAAGDTDAAAVFVRRYQSRIYGLAVTIVGSPTVAEEVAQEVFLRIWRDAGTYDARRGRVASWALTITRNRAIEASRLRGEPQVDPHGLVATLLSRQAAVSSEAGRRHGDEEEVRAALRGLPPEQSRLIVLSVYYGLTAEESAELEGVPLGTAKTRIRRGLAKLRAALGVRGG
jgi:RNA polymerase sigma factor (sigma-70 family)